MHSTPGRRGGRQALWTHPDCPIADTSTSGTNAPSAAVRAVGFRTVSDTSGRHRGSMTLDDIDPLDATTAAEFAECLRKVRLRAGNPSYRTLQQWGDRNKVPLPRSTVQDALAGRRLPRKTLALGFIRACGVPTTDR